ncbi:hypothetical protein [Microbacterium sp. HJ5]
MSHPNLPPIVPGDGDDLVDDGRSRDGSASGDDRDRGVGVFATGDDGAPTLLTGDDDRPLDPDADDDALSSADADERAATEGTLDGDVDDRP